MRHRSGVVKGFQVFAVSGINTVSFAVTATDAARKGLLGFAVERVDRKEGQRYFMYGYKVFRSVIPHPEANTRVSTFDHPVQSFVWDDFTAKPDRDYIYYFYPLRGTPRNIDHQAAPISITVKTEPLYSRLPHDVFFNRGVASSQAYSLRFKNLRPDEMPALKAQEALDWLSRDLDDAILRFIRQAKRGDALLGCFYEFTYRPVADEFKAAIDRGVEVKLIIDAKVNESTDKKGHFHPSFPRADNLDMLTTAGIPGSRVILRESRANDIQHNKFMVLLKGKSQQPAEVWTGSTNISMGGIHGQTNVGHWVRDPELAGAYQTYWDLLSGDPGARAGDSAADKRRKNAEFRAAVEAIQDVPLTLAAIRAGVTPVFSPRSGLKALGLYFDLVDGAQTCACITLAFGINKAFKAQLQDNTSRNAVMFLMLEKKDEPDPDNRDAFVVVNAKNNVYKAWGSFLGEPLYQWTKETNAKALRLNRHVGYVHSKFLLRDPLGDDPIIVTGSANFSDDSTNANDENMIIIRGDQRAADIYFTEFNRIFNHYYFRSVAEATADAGTSASEDTLFLKEKPQDWLVKYEPGKLRQKRVDIFAKMKGFTTL